MRCKLINCWALRGIALAIGWSLLSISPLSAAEKHSLRYQFRAGESVLLKVDNQSNLLFVKAEAEQQVKHGSVTDKRYTVQSVDADGNALLELQIDRVRLTAAADGGEPVTFDSDTGEKIPEAFRGIDGTVGKPHVRVKVSPSGKLLSLDWLIGQDRPSLPTKDDAADLDILVVLPEEPIAVGDTWKQPFETEIAATPSLKKKVKLQRQYTLEKVEGHIATVTLKTAVLTPLHDPQQEYQIVGKTPRGTIVFDIERGVVLSRTLKIDRTVVGFDGADDSKVRNISTRTESLSTATIADTKSGDAVTR